MYMHHFSKYEMHQTISQLILHIDLHNYGMSCTLRFESFINYAVLCIHQFVHFKNFR